jgi:uncharacterized tellurite resistance protein B-like protein
MNWRHMVLAGLLLVIGGATALYYAYSAGNASVAIPAWGALLAGAALLIGGGSRFMSEFMGSQHAPEAEYGKTEVRLLVQAMGAMAAADGRIADEEIASIAAVYERMLGMRIGAGEVRSILDGFDGDFDIAARLEAGRAELSPQMRRLVVQCCHLVMMSDAEEESHESEKLAAVADALGFSRDELRDITAAAGV